MKRRGNWFEREMPSVNASWATVLRRICANSLLKVNCPCSACHAHALRAPTARAAVTTADCAAYSRSEVAMSDLCSSPKDSRGRMCVAGRHAPAAGLVLSAGLGRSVRASPSASLRQPVRINDAAEIGELVGDDFRAVRRHLRWVLPIPGIRVSGAGLCSLPGVRGGYYGRPVVPTGEPDIMGSATGVREQH